MIPHEVSARCRLAQVTDLDFGTYTAEQKSDSESASDITLTCDILLELWDLGLDYGLNPGSASERRMSGPGGRLLTYALFQDAAHLLPWGPIGSGNELSGTYTGTAQVVKVYGVIEGFKDIPPGTYVDDVTATIEPRGSPFRQTFTVRVDVIGYCTVSTGDLDFGSLVSFGGGLPGAVAVGSIAVDCTTGVPYQVGLNGGLNPGGWTGRQMAGSGSTLSYEIHQDAGRIVPWGDIGSGQELNDVSTGVIQSHSVYGRIPTAMPAPPPGVYQDTVTVTVLW
jgi:spore coat protein U-like protein